MQTSVWGPKMWCALDATVGNAPDHIQPHRRPLYKSLLVDNICELAPCVHCRNSWKKYTDELPIEAFWHSRKALQYWLFTNHSRVNEKLSKPDISFFEYIVKVERMRAKCSKRGATGCTEPAIEKDGNQCRMMADEIWRECSAIDVDAFGRRSQSIRISAACIYAAIGLSIMFLFAKIGTRFVIGHKNSTFVKYLTL